MKKAPILAVFAVLLLAGYVYAVNFTDNGNGTVTDSITGLMWQQQDDGAERTWQHALDYCNGLSLAGHKDWRLPNKKELESIVDYESFNSDLPIDPTSFPNTKANAYWSSSTPADYPSDAWAVDFTNGVAFFGGKMYDGYVRCVR